MKAKAAKAKAKDWATAAVAFRLAADLIERVDAHARRMEAAQPGLAFSRSDAVRVLLNKALDLEESKAKGR